jgi:hypothetical protein
VAEWIKRRSIDIAMRVSIPGWDYKFFFLPIIVLNVSVTASPI